VLGAGLVGWSLGCTSQIHAPHAPENGETVYLVNAALHSGIVLSDRPNHWVEYGFGEYEWYAQDQDAWYRVIPCVLWGTQGTLGRREFHAADEDAVRRAAHASRVDRIVVEQAAATALRIRLQGLFEAGGEPLFQPRYNMSFVQFSSYWFLNNCHDATAGWFQELGCEVSWRPVRTGIEAAPEVD
jgi:hypothetical protein